MYRVDVEQVYNIVTRWWEPSLNKGFGVEPVFDSLTAARVAARLWHKELGLSYRVVNEKTGLVVYRISRATEKA
ncbi:MAG: hypothetical protein C5B59_08835 [Bacteroidetes bacterium]|nr:MAG: hypothetical protein C5B59_08835 [Bacteroidota bacterium]